MRTACIFSTALLVTLATIGCEEDKPTPSPTTAAPTASANAAPSASASATLPAKGEGFQLPELPYFPPMKTPEDNPLTQAKIDLGKKLFFDKRLGKDNAFACESCHFEDKGWADGDVFSKKASGDANSRHTPALFNVGYYDAWYWDGRAPTLEAQVLAAWKSQMGADPDQVATELAKIDGYKTLFKEAFGKEDITADDVVKALASYVRTIRSGNAPWDKAEKGDKSAVDESVKRGWELFRNKAGCAACHAPPLYTDNGFHNVGIGYDKPEPDVGRFKVTEKEEDKGRFKTPSLRSVTLHAPYFHDGSAKTLEEAVDYMLSGGHQNDNLDTAMKKVELTAEERADLIAFVKSLEGERPPFEKPELP